MSRTLLFLTSLFALLMLLPQNSKAEEKFITIGTGWETGVYYPAGGAICRFVNRSRKEHGYRCSVEATSGSIQNLMAISQGELDIGAAQSDWQYNAYNGKGAFMDQGTNVSLRALFSLHSEPFTVVARADAGIKVFDDLKGKRVNIGNPGSGMRATMEELMRVKGWTRDSFKALTEMKAAEQTKALCDNRIDAMLFAAGHPNGSILEVTNNCDAVLIPVEGIEIETFMKENPYYAPATIKGGLYRGNPDDVKTFGVKATFVSSESVEEEKIYQVVKAVFDNFESFKTLHYVFANLDKQKMVSDGLSAPLHAGALRYYREAGLISQ